MKSKKILIFDLFGEYGHFRKFNTTTSPLTYSIPTRTAIAGLLGAVIGIEREISSGNFPAGVTPVQELFSKDKADIAIQILAPIKKVNIGFNLLDTENSAASYFNIKQRTQIEFELLKNPAFRIYFTHEDEKVFEEVFERLSKRSHHFSPYLGLSQFAAYIDDVKLTKFDEVKSTSSVEVLTAVNLSMLNSNNPVAFDNPKASGLNYTSDTMPVQMSRDRVITEYSEVLIESTGRNLFVNASNYIEVDGHGNVLFL